MTTTCPFCEIVADRADAHWAVLRDHWPDAIAIRPLNPVTPGHTLVIPKTHVADFATDPEVSATTMRRAAELMRWTPRPMNLITSRGREATQSVLHLHLHLVPRTENDGLALPWHSGKHSTAAPASPDTDPAYDPHAWETYRRDAGCGCTAPAPVDCKVPHGTGAWLCICHRLAGPPLTDPGIPLSAEDQAFRKHFTEPNRCLSASGIFRCARPTGHPGNHRTGRMFWPRRAEDES